MMAIDITQTLKAQSLALQIQQPESIRARDLVAEEWEDILHGLWCAEEAALQNAHVAQQGGTERDSEDADRWERKANRYVALANYLNGELALPALAELRRVP